MHNVMQDLVKAHALDTTDRRMQPEIQHRLDSPTELVGYFAGFQPSPAGAANRWVIEDPNTGLRIVTPIWNETFPKENGIGLEGTLVSLRCETGRTYADPWTGEEKKMRTYRILSLDKEPPANDTPEPAATEQPSYPTA